MRIDDAPCAIAGAPTKANAHAAGPASRSTYRLDRPSLLKRVFAVDVLACARCGERMRVTAFVTKPDAVRRILRHLGLPDVALPVERARGPPQSTFDW